MRGSRQVRDTGDLALNRWTPMVHLLSNEPCESLHRPHFVGIARLSAKTGAVRTGRSRGGLPDSANHFDRLLICGHLAMVPENRGCLAGRVRDSAETGHDAAVRWGDL